MEDLLTEEASLSENPTHPPKYTASSNSHHDVDVTKPYEKLRPTPRTRHESFWFNDGNVIICVEERLFRVHMTVLRDTKSPFFAWLFAFSEPADEVIEGCDVYALQGRASDFAALLDALYGQLTRLVGKEPSFFTLACLLRASHHWEVSYLRAWAIQALTRRWPPSLDHVHNHVDLTEHATKVIVLSRECGEQNSLLKRAFYRLLSFNDFGIGPESKGASKGQGSEEYNHEEVKWAATDTELARDDISRVIRLHNYATLFWRLLTQRSPSYTFLSDQKRHGWWPVCAVKLGPIWHKQVTEAPFSIRGGRDPLGCLTDLRDIPWGTLGICEACVAGCRAHWKEQQEDFWKRIDKELGI